MSTLSSSITPLLTQLELIQNRLDGQPVLVFGKDGQVGKSLQKLFAQTSLPVIFVGRNECDLERSDAIKSLLNQYQPKIIINAAAYTAVDLAEIEIAKAEQINGLAVGTMASYMANVPNGLLIHFSTDYVFSGNQVTPYDEDDVTGPLSAYGKSKLSGELAIQSAYLEPTLQASSNNSTNQNQRTLNLPKYYILRTSWVYGEGNNFIRTMINLAKTREYLKVIQDQWGCPTSSDWLAQIAIQLTSSVPTSGIYNAVVDGSTSWHGLAKFAIERAKLEGAVVTVNSENIKAIPAVEYPLPAPRPYNSILSNHKLKEALKSSPLHETFPQWESQVESYVKQFVHDQLDLS